MPFIQSQLLDLICTAARKLKGTAKRSWLAHACRTYANGSPRAAETIFGFNRKSVARGLAETDTSERQSEVPTQVPQSNSVPQAPGRQRVEVAMPELLPIVEDLLPSSWMSGRPCEQTSADLITASTTQLNDVGASWSNIGMERN